MSTNGNGDDISIELPTIFKNLNRAKRFALDIGGSLVKIAYQTTVIKKKACVFEANKKNGNGLYSVGEEEEYQDQLHFVKFETKLIETSLGFIRDNLICSEEFTKNNVIKVTGGGAHKYRSLLTEKLGVEIDKEDEMECLIKGCDFLLKNIPDETFTYQKNGNPDYRFVNAEQPRIYPYLLVNIGSGVSILKVEEEGKYERVGGTSLGGGTFWGLGSVLTKAKGFDELLTLAESGDHRNVDMLVKDIYGGDYSGLLPGELLASSFGKAARSSQASEDDISSFRGEDIAKSLLFAVCNDIGQIAYLNAKIYGLKRIIFGGFFIRGHPLTMHTISFAINYWSKGEVKAMFLRHEGYMGAIGAFAKSLEEEDIFTSSTGGKFSTWGENYAESSCSCDQIQNKILCSPSKTLCKKSKSFDFFEMDRFSRPVISCPLLLDLNSYNPDTYDLTLDESARSYWLQCFENSTPQFVKRAIRSQSDAPDVEDRANSFSESYLSILLELKQKPCSFGSLTVRSLLDIREHCLEKYSFLDPYSEQKKLENQTALKFLGEHFNKLDQMDWDSLQMSLVTGLLAGNVFDWGAKEVVKLMEKDNFNFDNAMGILEERPWLFDDYDLWIKKLKTDSFYKNVAIFIDNSGFDIVLGVLPFARNLLKLGAKVVLCANSSPALNDVTYSELNAIIKRSSQICPIICQALLDEKLLIMQSGQGSPCLDLRYIDHDLASYMKDIDLIVLEGMGRAIHTNFHASFKCDALKVAVLKNDWLASQLGGKLFSIVFKYELSGFVKNSTT